MDDPLETPSGGGASVNDLEGFDPLSRKSRFSFQRKHERETSENDVGRPEKAEEDECAFKSAQTSLD